MLKLTEYVNVSCTKCQFRGHICMRDLLERRGVHGATMYDTKHSRERAL